MVSGRSLRKWLALFGAVLWTLAVSGASAHEGEPGSCEVHVNPRAAAAGSPFVFNGSGFVPTELELQKDGSEPISHDLKVGEADPWEVTVRSRSGDEGIWAASFTDPELDCTATVEFRVTLSNTDLIDDISAAATSSPSPVLLYLVVIVAGFGGGVLIGRRVRAQA